jgi:hypothetical protein
MNETFDNHICQKHWMKEGVYSLYIHSHLDKIYDISFLNYSAVPSSLQLRDNTHAFIQC